MIDFVAKKRDRQQQTAVLWHTRLTSGDISADERRQFETWRAHDLAHDAAYRKIEKLWQHLEEPVIADHSRRKQSSNFSVFQGRGNGLAVVASLLLMVSFGLFSDYLYQPWADYSTHVGERTTIRLEDGSVAYLNTDTAFNITFHDNERQVDLEQGEVEFEVAHDSHRPFRVQAGNTVTEALGTRFIVRYEHSVGAVTLLEGKVRTEQSSNINAVFLHPGERIAFDAQNLSDITLADVSTVEAWRRGRLIMNFVTLKQVVAEINRYHRGWVTLLSDTLANKEINVALDLNNIDAWLDTLKETLPLHVRRLGPFVFLQS